MIAWQAFLREKLEALWRALDNPRLTLLLVLGLYLVFFWARLSAHGGDVSRFVVAGSYLTRDDEVPAGLSILPNSMGYDGQFYYRLAIEPFTDERFDYGIALDSPAYRQQRILYPLLVYLASLGEPLKVATAMVVVNIIALALLGWLAGQLAQSQGQHALVGLGLALYPGLLLSFDRDLVEITQMLFLAGSMLLLVRQRHLLATVCLCLAVLAKETSLGLAAASLPALLWGLWRREERRPRWHSLVLPVGLFAGWQAWLAQNWGQAAYSISNIQANVAVPTSSQASATTRLPVVFRVLLRHLPLRSLTAVELLILLAFGVCVLAVLLRSQAPTQFKFAFLGYLGLMMVITHYAGGDWAFLRALSEYWIIGGIVLLAGYRWMGLPFALATSCWWLFTAHHVIAFR